MKRCTDQSGRSVRGTGVFLSREQKPGGTSHPPLERQEASGWTETTRRFTACFVVLRFVIYPKQLNKKAIKLFLSSSTILNIVVF